MALTIWHNPRCSKSQRALALSRKKGVGPIVREYLEEPPGRAMVETLIDLVGGDPVALVRGGEAEFGGLEEKRGRPGKADIAQTVAAHPLLLQRPIVASGRHGAIGRPPEAALPLPI